MTQFKTFTDAEREALKLHGLSTTSPSQLSDAFVLGMRYAAQHKVIAQLDVVALRVQEAANALEAARVAVGTAGVAPSLAPDLPPLPEPDCWAVLTPNGSKLVPPDEAKGAYGAYGLYTSRQMSEYRLAPHGVAIPSQPLRYRWAQDEPDEVLGLMEGPVPDGAWVKWDDVKHLFSAAGVEGTPK